MMNQDNPYAMNQTCKVCGEPAAGFHFGAFTCEGCKSFFGRSYNNLSSISDCKNNGECIINKKNRTACKACRLRKCLMVGMSKSGSRYGRRSNWFKIHCLLQEQQQQAAAVMAAHQNQQQQQPGHHLHHPSAGFGMKPGGIPPPAAAAAALGMLGHPGAYPGLYPPRTKEEFMMLSLEEYAKHPAASPSVSSPDSHNSDSSAEVNGAAARGSSSLHHQSAKHISDIGSTASTATTSSSVGPPPPPPSQLRKDLSPFLPLHFPGLSAMPVMPPPSFLPPSHLLFSGYHPALYQHHAAAAAGLLKPSPEQQAAAAAVHHLFNNAPRFNPQSHSPPAGLLANSADVQKSLQEEREKSRENFFAQNDSLNNNHIPNGSKAAEELTKRFYLDAVLKSQQQTTPPPSHAAFNVSSCNSNFTPTTTTTTTRIPGKARQDYSISALVTPNSESGRDRNSSRQSNEYEDDDAEVEQQRADASQSTKLSNGYDSQYQKVSGSSAHDSADDEEHNNADDDGDDDDDDEDLVVSMTPPRSPVESNTQALNKPEQDEDAAPIDLSMKCVSSVTSSVSNDDSSAAPTHKNPKQINHSGNDSESRDNEKPSDDINDNAEGDDDVFDDNVENKNLIKLNNNNNNNESDNEHEEKRYLIDNKSMKRKLNNSDIVLKQKITDKSDSEEHSCEKSAKVSKLTAQSILDLSGKI